MRPASVFRIASITKQFTAALVLDLAEEGRLALDERAAFYLPERAWLGEITIRQLLLQTSGLPDYAADESGGGAPSESHAKSAMLDWIGRLASQPDFAPGERWAYSNSNYAVLGAIIEELTGQTYAQAVKERLLRPLGLAATAVDDPADLVPHRVRGYSAASGRPAELLNADWIHPSVPGPAGALRSTAADLLQWSEALFSGKVLDAPALAEMTTPGRLNDGRTTRFGMPEAWREGLRSDYALGMFVSDSVLGRRVWHSGDISGFITWMGHYPERQLTLVLLQNGDFIDIDPPAVERLIQAAEAC
jgi:D-alanyl-D-alanine carboxypeptidase